MRQRSTWNQNEIAQRTAAMSRTADPYAMNQDHLKQQPPADKYLTGDPSAFAEDVAPNDWSVEYSGGQVKRNEIGQPEMRGDTFNHAEKTASSEKVLIARADLATTVARLMLAGRKFSSMEEGEKVVEDQSVALMNLSDSDLVQTFQRLSNQQQDQQAQAGQQQQQVGQQQAQGGYQQQQAQQQAPQQGMQQQGQQQDQQAGQQQEQVGQQQMMGQQQVEAMVQKMVQEAMKQQAQQQGQKMAQDQQQQQAGQQQQQQAGQQQQAQQDQQQQAGQQQQQAGYQQQQAGQQQQAQQQAQGASAIEQQAGQQQGQGMMTEAHEDELLNQMLMPSAPAGTSEVDIQLEPAPMDVGEVQLGPEDDVLRTLFANQETQDAQEAQQSQGQQQQQEQGKQASVRTASTRVVGTRPTAGVGRIGGAGAPPVKGDEINKLTSLWNSAPDVSDAFGMRRS